MSERRHGIGFGRGGSDTNSVWTKRCQNLEYSGELWTVCRLHRIAGSRVYFTVATRWDLILNKYPGFAEEVEAY